MDEFLKFFSIDPVVVLMVLCGGFFSTKYLKGFKWPNDAWKTLIVGSIFSAGYIAVVFAQKEITPENWKSFFVSYVSTTSLYELFIKWLANKIKNITNAN